jgi:cyclophilin family peptidyl-prolyl cis-trans isomerase
VMRLALMPLFVAISFMFAGATAAMDKENTLYIDLKDGRVVIEMRPDLAPNHVKQIKKLAREGKYDGVPFHRVIEGFMAQTGDPTGTGSGGMGETLKSEFSKEPHVRGSVSMARTNDPNSARSQFFIVFKDSNFLDGQYTVWGKVTSGMEFVDKIKRGAPGSGAVAAPADKMIKVQVAADAKN